MISAVSIKNNFISCLSFLQTLSSVLLLLFLVSCDNNKIFEKNTNIYNSKWHALEIIPFDVLINDTVTPYNFYINIRNNTDYSYSNLYLFMTTIYPDKEISKDTIECIIADKNGKWFGNGIGKYRFLSLELGKNIKFPQKGTYTFQFEQAMRTDTLENITDIGIRIEKSSL